MRSLLFLFALALPASAHADSVLVMASDDAAHQLGDALRTMLAGRGVSITSMPSPSGTVPLERAAAAQRAAHEVGARAAVWIEAGEVYAVTADGQSIRHAPLLDATGLVGELVAPPAHRAAHAPQVATASRPVDAAAQGDAAEPLPGRAHPDRIQLEIGTMGSPVSLGAEAGISFPLSPVWRIAAMGSLQRSFVSTDKMGLAAFELRHAGIGAPRWDVGPMLGALFTNGEDPIALVGGRFGGTWELGRTSVSLSILPVIMARHDERIGTQVAGWVFGSLRVMLGL